MIREALSQRLIAEFDWTFDPRRAMITRYRREITAANG
jgi:hypothetical protein